MDHEVAASTNAIERYLLGEMPPPERDAFEEHYFSCPECAREIRSAYALKCEMQAALREIRPAAEGSSPGRLSWLRLPVMVPAFAAVVLAVVAGYQNAVVMPDLEAPRSMGSAVILDGRTRGGVPALHAGEPLRFVTALEGAPAGRLYVELDRAQGGRVRAGEVAAPGPNRPLDVLFPGSLGVGRYELVARDGRGGRELARSAFEIVN